MITEARPALVNEAFQVGGEFSRFSRAVSRAASCAPRRSADARCARVSRSFRPGSRDAWCGACASSGPCRYRSLAVSRDASASSMSRDLPPASSSESRRTRHAERVRRARRRPVAVARDAPRPRPPAASRGGPRRWSRPARRPGARATARSRGRPAARSAPDSRIVAAIAGRPRRRRRRQLDVEGHQRRARRDQHRTGRAGASRGPKSGASSPSAIAPRELGRAAAPELDARVRPPAELAVEEHRQPELLAEPVSERKRLGRAGRGPRAQVDDWRHVERAHTRMDALLAADVDPFRHFAGAVEHRVRQLTGAPASVYTLRWWSGSEWTSSSRASKACPSASISF